MMAAALGVLAEFPHESVPDGYVLAPHHAYVGLLVTAVAAWVVSDNHPHREVVVTAAGCLLLGFGFLLTWRWYPGTGAALSLLGCALMVGAPLVPGGEWAGYPLTWRVVAMVGGLVALDDVVEHAFRVGTPLDSGWQYIWPLLP